MKQKVNLKPFLTISFILSILTSSMGATVSKNQLSGIVTDAKTGEPIEMVNVFFVNTTIGTATGPDGRFILENFPPGSYDLIINHVSYEMQSLHLEYITPESQHYEFHLKPKIYKAEEIKVEAREPKKWKSDLNKFTKIFLGKTTNSKLCKIINPQVLEFSYDKDHWFVARADSDLIVENRSLGYRLDIIIKSFRYNNTHDKTQYILYPKFTELIPDNPNEQKRWTQNRYACYKGSLKNFIRSVAKDNLREENFEVYHTMRLQLKGYPVDPVKAGFIKPDPTEEAFKQLQFENYLSVYHKPSEDIIYDTWIDALYKETEKSFIKLNTKYVLIDTLGNVYSHFPMSVYGFWTKRGVADLLPHNFFPNKQP